MGFLTTIWGFASTSIGKYAMIGIVIAMLLGYIKYQSVRLDSAHEEIIALTTEVANKNRTINDLSAANHNFVSVIKEANAKYEAMRSDYSEQIIILKEKNIKIKEELSKKNAATQKELEDLKTEYEGLTKDKNLATVCLPFIKHNRQLNKTLVDYMNKPLGAKK